MEYVDTQRVKLREVGNSVVKELIEQNHYTHNFPNTRYNLGVFYESDEEHPFFEQPKEDLIGAVTFSFPVGRQVISSISPLLSNKQVLELTRLYIHDGYGKNIESYVIGQSFNWLKAHVPTLECVVSYADPSVGHMGTIYQATNFLYQGNEIQQIQSYQYRLEPEGEWIHPRTIVERYGSQNIDHLKNVLGRSFWMKEYRNKHRYLYFLCGKRRRKKLIKSLKHPILPYPDEESFVEPEVTLIEVNNAEREYV